MDLLHPDWPAPANVRAACSTRVGGVSQGAHASLNLGDHVGDDAAHVAENRKRYAQALGARPVFLKQVHGTGVVLVDEDTLDGTEADAAISISPGIACTMMVADCLAVLLCDDAGRVVAAAHAGWRGLAGVRGQGVLEAVCADMFARIDADAHLAAPKVLAWLGPCIGPSAFEVGAEVAAAFTDTDPGAERHFVPHAQGKFLADLPALARRRLHALGITRIHGNDGSDAWCTVTNASRFFSHRRDGVSGRFAASIWLG